MASSFSETIPDNLPEKARQYMDERKGHCAQSVLTTFGEHHNLLDHEHLMRVSSAFSGGIAATGNVCGALTGALMALGLRYGDEGAEKVNKISRKFLDEFTKLNGLTICRELINHHLLTDADVKHAFETGAFKNCPKYVEDASAILEKMLYS